MLRYMDDFLWFSERKYQLTTFGEQYPDNLTWISTNEEQFMFEVTDCEGAHIYLSRNPGVPNESTYVISIDAAPVNRISMVYLNTVGMVTRNESAPRIHPIDCNYPIQFWIDWAGMQVTIGHGTRIAQNPIVGINYQHQIKGVGLSTESSTGGSWRFNAAEGE